MGNLEFTIRKLQLETVKLRLLKIRAKPTDIGHAAYNNAITIALAVIDNMIEELHGGRYG